MANYSLSHSAKTVREKSLFLPVDIIVYQITFIKFYQKGINKSDFYQINGIFSNSECIWYKL
jgi:hypothetical protein